MDKKKLNIKLLNLPAILRNADKAVRINQFKNTECFINKKKKRFYREEALFISR